MPPAARTSPRSQRKRPEKRPQKGPKKEGGGRSGWSGRPFCSGAANVLGARALRPLTRVERERLALTELVETPVDDGGLVEEVLVSVRRLDEPETLVADQALDDALHAGHVNISRRRRRRRRRSRRPSDERRYQRGSRRERPPPAPWPAPERGAIGRASFTMSGRPPNGCSFSWLIAAWASESLA